MSKYWLLFAFLTPVLGAFLSIVNKWLIDKHFPNPVSSLIFMLLGNLIYLIPAVFFLKINMSFVGLVSTLLLGIVFGLMYFFQMKMIKVRDASEVAIISRLKPIVVMVLAYLLLGEVLRVKDYFGVVFLSLGGMIIASKDINFRKLKFSGYLKSLGLFILISSLVSVGRKIILVNHDFWAVFYWINFGSVLGALFLLLSKNYRQDFIKYIKNAPKKVFTVKVFAQIIFIISFIFNMLALKYGPVSIVSATYSLQPMLVLLYASIISKFFPNVIQEDMSKTAMTKKIVSVGLIIFGSWLII